MKALINRRTWGTKSIVETIVLFHLILPAVQNTKALQRAGIRDTEGRDTNISFRLLNLKHDGAYLSVSFEKNMSVEKNSNSTTRKTYIDLEIHNKEHSKQVYYVHYIGQ